MGETSAEAGRTAALFWFRHWTPFVCGQTQCPGPEGKGDGKAYFLNTCYVLGAYVLSSGFLSQF